MQKNIGMPDRLIRLAIALAFFVAAYWWSSWILLAVAIFTLYEAVAGWCAFYQLIGKNTCDIPRK